MYKNKNKNKKCIQITFAFFEADSMRKFFLGWPRHPLALTRARLLKREKYIFHNNTWQGAGPPQGTSPAMCIQNHGIRTKCPNCPLHHLSPPSLFLESWFCRGRLYLWILQLQLLNLYFLFFLPSLFVMDIICMS
jgi:hypothetical protein